MANNKQGAVKKPLSLEEKNKIAEEVLGVHPRYLIKRGLNLQLDIYKLEADSGNFTDWKHKEHHEE